MLSSSSGWLISVKEFLEAVAKYFFFFKLNSNLIDRWSNQAYIMLDTLGINKMIEDCKNDEMNVELNRLAEKLAANVVGFKANLRRFYVVNGYPKKLN
jgi:hypothetical protein